MTKDILDKKVLTIVISTASIPIIGVLAAGISTLAALVFQFLQLEIQFF